MKLNEPLDVKKEDILSKINLIISPKVGIVKKIINISRSSNEPLIFSTSCNLCNTLAFSNNKCFPRHGGAGLTEDDAIIAGVSEALERYCSSIYDEDELFFGNYMELKDIAIPPECFALFSARQYNKKGFPFLPFTEETNINWTRSYSLIDDREKLVPAQMVYMPYNYSDGEAIITYSSSTGLSCRTSMEEAILFGLYEVIERDAFILFWLSRPTVGKVDISELDGSLDFVRERYDLTNWNHYICDITNDLEVPTFFTLSFGQLSFGKAVCVGASSSLSPEKAIAKSLLESAQATSFLLYKLSEEKKFYREDFSDVVDFDDHGEFYTRMSQYHSVFDFITDSKESNRKVHMKDLSEGSIKRDINALLRIFKKKKMDVLFVDLTTSDIRDLGFRVVKVIVPKLIPLHGNHNYPFKGSPRLFEVPKKWGEKLSEEDLNPFPHPFP